MIRPTLSIVVPVFNEELLIGELITRIDAAAKQTGLTYEILIVDDGSRDATWAVLQRLRPAVPALHPRRLRRNFGQMAALTAGLSLASGDAVISMDGDLQDPPELIPMLVAQWKEGANVVYGKRTPATKSFIAKTGTHVFYFLLDRLTGSTIPQYTGTCCLIDKHTVEILLSMPEAHRYFSGQRAWVGGNQACVMYERNQRKAGESRYGLIGLMRLARSAIYSFSSKPLIVIALFSLISASLMLCIGLSAIAIRLFTNLAIPGWATFTTLIGFMGFTQSLVLMFLSEYLAIVYDEVKRRPLFLLEEEKVERENQPLI